MSGYSLNDLENLPADPAPDDLGHRSVDFEVVRTETADGVVNMFVPRDDDFLREDAFIVADDAATCSLADRR